jgi:hypothetical protein
MNGRWLILLLLPFASLAQSDSIAWSRSVMLGVSWPEPVSAIVPFSFSADITIIGKQQKIGTVLHDHDYMEARWIRSSSCMADSLKLTHRPLAQLYFDCYELAARRVQEQVNLENTDHENVVSLAEQHAAEFIAYIRTVTNEGTDPLQMHKMRSYMDSLLRVTPRIEIPEWEYSGFGIGLDAGYGVSAFSGELESYFGTVDAFSIGAGCHYKRLNIDYRVLSGRAQSGKDFSLQDFKFADTNRLRVNQGTLSAGFCVVNSARLLIAPYVGLSSLRVINRDEPPGSFFRKGPVSFNFETGFLAEWNFLPAYQNNTALFSWKLTFKAGYANEDYLYVIAGGSLKFLIGFGFNVGGLRNSSASQD